MILKRLAAFVLAAGSMTAPVPCIAAPWSVALGTDADEEALAVASAYDGSIPADGYALLPLTLVTTWAGDVVQSAHDPVHAAFAEPRPPCTGQH